MIIPLLYRILVKPEQVETKTASGIVLALNEKREQAAAEKGTVIRVGEMAFKDYGGTPEHLKVGDTVFFAKYAGKFVKDTDEQDYVLLNDDDIIGIIRND